MVSVILRTHNGSVELPKTTHLPKTTENHLENHIYRVIIPSLYLFFSSLCLYISHFVFSVISDFSRVTGARPSLLFCVQVSHRLVLSL